MAYPAVITADAPYFYTPFTGNSLNNTGSKAGVSQTSAGVVFTTGTAYTGVALNFNATNSHVQYNIGNDNLMGSPQWSAEAWIKKGTLTTWANIIHREENPAEGRNQFVLRVDAPGSTNSEKVTLTIQRNGVSAQLVGPFVDNNWHHVAVTSDGTTMRMYYDGVQVASAASLTPVFVLNQFRLGAYGTTAGNENWVGLMDEVAIYKTTLSPARVQQHYFDGLGIVNVSVDAPPLTANASIAAPVVIASTPKNISATPLTASASMPGGEGFAQRNVGVAAAPMTATAAAPGGNRRFTTVSSLLFDDTTINQEAPTQTGDGEGGSIRYYSSNGGRLRYYAFKIDKNVLPNSNDVANVSLKLWVDSLGLDGSATAASGAIYFHPVNRDFTESETWNTLSSDIGASLFSVSPGTYNADATLTITLTQAQFKQLTDLPYGVALSLAANGSVNFMASEATDPAQRPYFSVAGDFSAGDQINSTTPMSASVVMPNAKFFTPDAIHSTTAMEATTADLFPAVVAGSSTVTTAVAAEANAVMLDAEFTNVTDLLFEVPPMVATFKWIVPYNPDDDRYLNYLPYTMDADDIWLKLEETSGTIAADSMTNSQGQVATTGTYRGAPVFAVEGPQLRKAVSFPTTADYLEINYPTDPTSINLFSNSEFTTEFSFKTTQLNGEFSEDARLVNGEFAFGDPGTNTYVRVRKFVADGEWHHIVVSTPLNGNPQGVLSDDRPSFVMIDGVTEYKRFLGGGVLVALRAPKTLMRGINGSIRDFVFRINYAVSESTASKLYYEWSNANIISAEPFTISAAMGQGSTAKGNQKRMLVLYGLSTETGQYANGAQSERGNYQSPFSGLRLRTRQGAAPGPREEDGMISLSNPFRSSFTGYVDYYFVHPFNYQGYSVYPVSLAGGFDRTGEIKSVPNIVSDEYKDRLTGNFVEDRTGLNRFIDLDRDLIGDVTEFDALTVFNYPAYAPVDTGGEGDGISSGSQYPFSQSNKLLATNTEWSTARDNFRDTILRAWSRGVALWITEPDQAQHMGFIQAWDEHLFGEWLESPEEVAPMSNTNNAGLALDLAHSGSPGFTLGRSGDYVSLYQSNIYRKIVATEPGLTTIGSAEVTARANGYKFDSFAAYGQQMMYDIVNKPDGLRIGDQIEMSHYDRYSNLGFRTGENWTALKTLEPTRIWSARPEGIIGKVISKEMDSYFGPYGTVVQNPYRDNVYTIAVAPGTQVRGFTGGARAFIEFMDHDAGRNGVVANRARDLSRNSSTWSFDSRRSKETAMTVSSTKVVVVGGIAQQITTETQYVDVVDDVDYIYYKYVGMNARGLSWLAGVDEEVDLGDVKVYAPSMTASADIVSASNMAARTNTVTATAMRATAAIITPANFPASDVEILPLPMEALAQFSGVNMTVVAPPMTGTVGGGSPIVNTSGDRIRVFIDSDRTVRLFLKEDEY